MAQLPGCCNKHFQVDKVDRMYIHVCTWLLVHKVFLVIPMSVIVQQLPSVNNAYSDSDDTH